MLEDFHPSFIQYAPGEGIVGLHPREAGYFER